MIPISAVDYTVGIKEGDWIKYGEVRVSWTGTGTEPSYVSDMKRLDWIKANIETISGTTVTIATAGKFRNGTSIPSSSLTIDIATGQGSAGTIMLIAANLKEGDSIPTQYGRALEIDGTVAFTYCGAARSVNFVDLTASYIGTISTTGMYWDKATGILVEVYMSTSYTSPSAQSMELSYKALETNMWSPNILGLISRNSFTSLGS